MNEADWLTWHTVADLRKLVGAPHPRPLSDRLLRLFGCACVRQIWDIIDAQDGRDGVEIAEAAAERPTKLSHARARVYRHIHDEPRPSMAHGHAYTAAWATTWRSVRQGAWKAGSESIHACEEYVTRLARDQKIDLVTAHDVMNTEITKQAHFFRDIAGNPFRYMAWVQETWLSAREMWLTPTVSDVAAAAYNNRLLPEGFLDPVRLNILTDALLDTGCDDAYLLTHLRDPGPHIRGCWAIDLLLDLQ